MRYCLLFLLSIGFCSQNIAQKIKDEKPKFARAGFKGGVNYSFINGDFENTGGRVRAHFGALVEYPITNTFFVQGELFYSAQGYTIDVEQVEQEVGMNYISLPILTKYYITKTIAIEGGVQLASLSTFGNEDLADNDPFYDSFNDFDWGAALGLAYYLESGLFFQARYYSGLQDFNNTAIKAHNQLFQFSVGYLFKTKDNRRLFDEETQDSEQ